MLWTGIARHGSSKHADVVSLARPCFWWCLLTCTTLSLDCAGARHQETCKFLAGSSMEGKKHKKGKGVKKERALLEAVPQAPQESDGNSKFARALGSTDYVTREKGLQALTRFLTYKHDISELDMLKLWKGLFFCFWHSDKAPVQVRTELLQHLSAATHRELG